MTLVIWSSGYLVIDWGIDRLADELTDNQMTR
jgi:hypothetical protein